MLKQKYKCIYSCRNEQRAKEWAKALELAVQNSKGICTADDM